MVKFPLSYLTTTLPFNHYNKNLACHILSDLEEFYDYILITDKNDDDTIFNGNTAININTAQLKDTFNNYIQILRKYRTIVRLSQYKKIILHKEYYPNYNKLADTIANTFISMKEYTETGADIKKAVSMCIDIDAQLPTIINEDKDKEEILPNEEESLLKNNEEHINRLINIYLLKENITPFNKSVSSGKLTLKSNNHKITLTLCGSIEDPEWNIIEFIRINNKKEDNIKESISIKDNKNVIKTIITYERIYNSILYINKIYNEYNKIKDLNDNINNINQLVDNKNNEYNKIKDLNDNINNINQLNKNNEYNKIKDLNDNINNINQLNKNNEYNKIKDLNDNINNIKNDINYIKINNNYNNININILEYFTINYNYNNLKIDSKIIVNNNIIDNKIIDNLEIQEIIKYYDNIIEREINEYIKEYNIKICYSLYTGITYKDYKEDYNINNITNINDLKKIISNIYYDINFYYYFKNNIYSNKEYKYYIRDYNNIIIIKNYYYHTNNNIMLRNNNKFIIVSYNTNRIVLGTIKDQEIVTKHKIYIYKDDKNNILLDNTKDYKTTKLSIEEIRTTVLNNINILFTLSSLYNCSIRIINYNNNNIKDKDNKDKEIYNNNIKDKDNNYNNHNNYNINNIKDKEIYNNINNINNINIKDNNNNYNINIKDKEIYNNTNNNIKDKEIYNINNNHNIKDKEIYNINNTNNNIKDSNYNIKDSNNINIKDKEIYNNTNNINNINIKDNNNINIKDNYNINIKDNYNNYNINNTTTTNINNNNQSTTNNNYNINNTTTTNINNINQSTTNNIYIKIEVLGYNVILRNNCIEIINPIENEGGCINSIENSRGFDILAAMENIEDIGYYLINYYRLLSGEVEKIHYEINNTGKLLFNNNIFYMYYKFNGACNEILDSEGINICNISVVTDNIYLKNIIYYFIDNKLDMRGLDVFKELIECRVRMDYAGRFIYFWFIDINLELRVDGGYNLLVRKCRNSRRLGLCSYDEDYYLCDGGLVEHLKTAEVNCKVKKIINAFVVEVLRDRVYIYANNNNCNRDIVVVLMGGRVLYSGSVLIDGCRDVELSNNIMDEINYGENYLSAIRNLFYS